MRGRAEQIGNTGDQNSNTGNEAGSRSDLFRFYEQADKETYRPWTGVSWRPPEKKRQAHPGKLGGYYPPNESGAGNAVFSNSISGGAFAASDLSTPLAAAANP